MPDKISYDSKNITAEGVIDSITNLLSSSPKLTILALGAFICLAYAISQCKHILFFKDASTQSVKKSTIKGEVSQTVSNSSRKNKAHQQVEETEVGKKGKIRQKI